MIGYCCDNNTLEPLTYRLNGLVSLLISSGIFCLLSDDLQITLYRGYYSALVAANLVGIIFSTYLYFRGGKEKYKRCVTIDQLKDKSFLRASNNNDDTENEMGISTILKDYFLGHEWNIRLFDIDIKMILYLIGAIGLELNILSALFKHIQIFHKVSYAMLSYLICMNWFIVEYMIGEEIHLYTYDLFAEKVSIHKYYVL